MVTPPIISFGGCIGYYILKTFYCSQSIVFLRNIMDEYFVVSLPPIFASMFAR